MRTKLPVKAIGTTLEIAETLVRLDGATVSELQAELERPSSTIHDHLFTLKRLGYVFQDNEEYHVSARFLELGAQRRKNMAIFTVAKPELHRLADEMGEHSGLMIEENGLCVRLYTAKGKKAVKVDDYSGARSKLNVSAPGKAILAHMSERRLEQVLERHGLGEMTQNTITDRDTLMEELATVREMGYAFDRQELFNGMRGVATPLLSNNDEVQGAISVYGPVNRLSDDRFEGEVPQSLLKAANVIEVNLTYA